MRNVENIKDEIRKLNADDQVELRRWLQKLESNQWDQQIEEDAQAGKLDKIADKAGAALWNRLLEGQPQKNARSKTEIDHQIREERTSWDH